jgi:hypothetical protein
VADRNATRPCQMNANQRNRKLLWGGTEHIQGRITVEKPGLSLAISKCEMMAISTCPLLKSCGDYSVGHSPSLCQLNSALQRQLTSANVSSMRSTYYQFRYPPTGFEWYSNRERAQ